MPTLQELNAAQNAHNELMHGNRSAHANQIPNVTPTLDDGSKSPSHDEHSHAAHHAAAIAARLAKESEPEA